MQPIRSASFETAWFLKTLWWSESWRFQHRSYFKGPVFSETTPKVIQSTEGASRPAASTPPAAESTSNASYDKLSTPLRVLVDKLVDMGFDLGVTSRAADHFGSDEKQVRDYFKVIVMS